jgi:pimeloyl-ACP methyl ester carboxylesterase
MGGMIAQEFAISYPHRLKSLILGCTHCGGTNMVLPSDEAQSFLLGPAMAKLSAEERARKTVPWMWTQESIDNNPGMVEMFTSVAVKYPTPVHGYRCQAKALMAHDTYDRLTQIMARTLVITGAADRIIPAENSRIIASRIPNAELVILENAGHGFFIDAGRKSIKIILDFLSQHSKSKN